MICKLRWTPEALKDLDRIWEEVLEASGEMDTADRYIAWLRMAVSRKREFPESGTPLNFMGVFTGIRFVHFKRYLAFYRIQSDRLEVIRILFDSSDYMNKLFGYIDSDPGPVSLILQEK